MLSKESHKLPKLDDRLANPPTSPQLAEGFSDEELFTLGENDDEAALLKQLDKIADAVDKDGSFSDCSGTSEEDDNKLEYEPRYPEWKIGEDGGDELVSYLEGTHTISTVTFKMLKASAPIPLLQCDPKRARKTCIPLPKLQAHLKKRPNLSHATIADYIASTATEKTKYHDLSHTVPQRNAVCYAYRNMEKFYAYDWRRTVKCKRCNTMMIHPDSKEAKAAAYRPEQAAKYSVCCYKKPKYTAVKARTLNTDIDNIYTIVYDIETYSVETFNNGLEHKFFCIAAKSELSEEIFTSTNDFMEFVDKEISRLNRLPIPDGKHIVLHLVSFNGSRYDDLFLTKEWRAYIMKKHSVKAFEQIHYSERQRSISHNNLKLGNVKVVWCDVLRFMPPSSLAKAALDYGLSTQKGNFPFEVLNAFGRRDPIQRETDFFFSLSYFGGNKQLRQDTLEYYIEKLGMPTETSISDDADVRKLCYLYCMQDVVVTHQLYICLKDMYIKYLTPCLVECEEGANIPNIAFAIGFFPMALHSMSSLSAQVMVYNALMKPHRVFSTGGQPDVEEKKTVEIFAPTCDTYTFEREAVYGGWVRGYYQGLFFNKELSTKHCGQEWTTELERLCDAAELPLNDVDLIMGDIASMYPNAITYPMPIGKGKMIYDEERKDSLIEEMLDCENPCLIPKFIVRAKMQPPKSPCYFSSTLPQRTREKGLAWTYRSDYGAQWTHYTSLDLWIACRGSIENNDMDTAWTILKTKEMIYYENSSNCYADFMIQCAKGKRDGANSGNESMRTCFKVVMNGGIGKLGQRIEAQMNVIGEENMYTALSSMGGRASLVGSQTIKYKHGYQTSYENTEYVLSTRDTRKNIWPQAHAAFMYASTRLMRLIWARQCMPKVVRPIIEERYPIPIYGDTDSMIMESKAWNRIDSKYIGDVVGVFDVDTGDCNMNIELEKVSNEKTDVILTGIMGPKAYFMIAIDKKSGKQVLKFKCKGQTQYTYSKHPCHQHSTISCTQCACAHSCDVYTCIRCIIPSLSLELLGDSSDDDDVDTMTSEWSSNLPYKYAGLRGLSLSAFVRTLMTGVSCSTSSDTFSRSLSLSSAKQSDFSVSTIRTERKLSKPLIACTPEEMKNGRPLNKGAVMPNVNLVEDYGAPGVLYPDGDYLYT